MIFPMVMPWSINRGPAAAALSAERLVATMQTLVLWAVRLWVHLPMHNLREQTKPRGYCFRATSSEPETLLNTDAARTTNGDY
jgi:hypothetical protein